MDYAALFIYVIIATFTPGPNNILCMMFGARSSIKVASNYIIGAVIGCILLDMCSGLLNVMLATLIPTVEPVLKWVGMAYMLYLAYKIANSSNVDSGGYDDGLATVKNGFILQYVNVKSILFSLTVFSVFVIPYTKSLLFIFLLCIIFGILAGIAMLMWAWLGAGLSDFYNKYTKPFNYVMALLIIYCAISVVI